MFTIILVVQRGVRMFDQTDDFVAPDLSDDNTLYDEPDPPFSLPDDADDAFYLQHQSTDDELDPTELYNEGIAGASGRERPDNGSVLSYTPVEDQT